MKKLVRNIACYTGGILFALAPVILLIAYFTYTEKIVLSVTMLIMIVCAIILIITDEE